VDTERKTEEWKEKEERGEEGKGKGKWKGKGRERGRRKEIEDKWKVFLVWVRFSHLSHFLVLYNSK